MYNVGTGENGEYSCVVTNSLGSSVKQGIIQVKEISSISGESSYDPSINAQNADNVT